MIPFMIVSDTQEKSPTDWVLENKSVFDQSLLKYGAILLRDFRSYNIDEFEQFITKTSGHLLVYKNRSTPRTLLSGRIYTSTEYPADQAIPQHNENSYTHEWPRRLFFCCIVPATNGGQTPISDSRKVIQRIPKDIVERFVEQGVMYIRTFTKGLGLSWQETFQMTDRTQMQRYCQKNNIVADWLSDGRLRIKQVLKATIEHPATGELVWFNQAHLFHLSSLPTEIRLELEKTGAPDEMPRNAFYGNGEPIDQESLQQIRQAYDQEEKLFNWRQGDILVLDNILVAHGRKPFEGERKVVVGMT